MACSCANFGEPLTVKDYNSSQFILSGQALKVTFDSKAPYYKQRNIEFRVDKIYKGILSSDTVTIHTSSSDASCGLFVKENEEWVIWAYLQNDTLLTNLCTRSTQKKHVSKFDLELLDYFKSNPSTSDWKNKDGKLVAIGQIKNNIPYGYWKYFYENGYLESEGNYKNGAYDGKWIKYLNPNGIVTRLRYDKKIPNDSTPDLRLLQNKVWEVVNYRNGIREGEHILFSYSSIDKPKRIINYKNDKYDGKLISYHDNGLVYYEQNYKDGKLNGYERFYYSNGQLKYEGNFIRNKATGEFRMYNETGDLIKTTYDKRPE